MARRAEFREGVINLAKELVAEGETVRDVKLGLSVVLSAELGLSNARVAAALGVGTATVARMHGELRARLAGTVGDRATWGGRRHQNLTVEEEKAFLKPWEDEAGRGGVLVVPPIRAALEARIGHRVAASTVYRLLARHGWRRVEPDSAHPKRDPEAQEAFKKGASRKAWRRR